MQVQKYRVPVSSFPQMNYACRNSSDIYKKYNTFFRGFVLEEYKPNTYDDVLIHICKSGTDTHFPVEISDVVRQREGLILVETTSYENMNMFLNQQLNHKNKTSVVLLDAEFCNKISTLKDNLSLFVFLSEKPVEKSDVKSTDKIFSTKDCVIADLGNLLEKHVLKPMGDVCEFLCKIRSSVDDSSSECREQAAPNPVIGTERKLDRGMDDLQPSNEENVKTKEEEIKIYRTLMSKDDTCRKRKSKAVKRTRHTFSRKKYRNVKHLEEHALDDVRFLERIDCEAVDRLLKSIRALYWMTNIPVNQQPSLPVYQPKKLNEKICDKLSALGRAFKGMGYKLNKLIIFLSEDVKEKREIEMQVGKILKQFDVRHQIEYISEHIQQLMHVGAKLGPEQGYGTLGCFATMDGGAKCILLSKHVAKCGKEMYFENKRKVCKILPATVTDDPGDLDIAAADIYPKENICSTKFKDSTGKQMKGILYEYNGEDRLITESRKVHIWGASSMPGRGEIEIAEFKSVGIDCQQTLIQVIDGDTESSFAEAGDSGAIVCVDHPDDNFVHAVGMLIGQDFSRGTKGRIYYILPLSNGLKQLERKTRKRFELC